MVDKILETDIIISTTDEILSTDSSSEVDVTPGTGVVDIAIEGMSKQLSDSSDEIVDAERAIALDEAENMSESDVDKKAKNFLVTREQATYATGTVIFYRRFPPSGTYTIPVGTVVTTRPDASGNYISFTTTTSASISTSTAINTLTNRYEASASVVANTKGLAGTAGRNLVTNLLNAISGIDGCVNRDAIVTGAEDQETNIEITNRIRLTRTSKSKIGTRTGYQEIIVDYLPSTIAADVVGPTDSAMKRAEFGNEIDIYIEGQNPQAFVDTLSFNGATMTYLNTRPCLSLSSVVGSTNGVTYTNATQWVFYQDTTPGFGYSTKALDAVMWISGFPSTGTSLYVTGTYDKNVADLQSYLTDESRRVVSTNLLVKDAQKILIDVNCNVAIFSGYNQSSVVAAVKTAITNYIDGLVLGDRVEQADLVSIIANVEGVDEVQIPFTTLKTSTEVAGTVHDIGLNRSQYPRTNTSTLTVGVL